MNLEKVLCVPTSIVEDIVPKFNASIENASEVLENLLKYQVHCVRDDGNGGGCENDERLQQLIPYVVTFASGSSLCYQRKGGGEKRLDTMWSVGFGGHVNDEDGNWQAGVNREIEEELDFGPYAKTAQPWRLVGPIGFIRETDNPVGRVHIGVLYRLYPDEGAVMPKEDVVSREIWIHDAPADIRLERWSQIAIDMLTGE
jgi:predicted NUDIX family phosphoesterase